LSAQSSCEGMSSNRVELVCAESFSVFVTVGLTSGKESSSECQWFEQGLETKLLLMLDLQLKMLFLSFLKVIHLLCLLLDPSLNMSTSHITSTLSMLLYS